MYEHNLGSQNPRLFFHRCGCGNWRCLAFHRPRYSVLACGCKFAWTAPVVVCYDAINLHPGIMPDTFEINLPCTRWFSTSTLATLTNLTITLHQLWLRPRLAGAARTTASLFPPPPSPSRSLSFSVTHKHTHSLVCPPPGQPCTHSRVCISPVYYSTLKRVPPCWLSYCDCCVCTYRTVYSSIVTLLGSMNSVWTLPKRGIEFGGVRGFLKHWHCISVHTSTPLSMTAAPAIPKCHFTT